MKLLSDKAQALNEDLYVHFTVIPVFYRSRVDLLKPASEIFKGNEMVALRATIDKDSGTVGKKIKRFLLLDDKKTVSALVEEIAGKKYTLTMSTSGNAPDFHMSFPSFDSVQAHLEKIGIPAETLQKSAI